MWAAAGGTCLQLLSRSTKDRLCQREKINLPSLPQVSVAGGSRRHLVAMAAKLGLGGLVPYDEVDKQLQVRRGLGGGR